MPYPTAAVLERPGLLGIAKLEAGGRGYAGGAVAGTALERPGLSALPTQQAARGFPAGEVHATATIQMGPGWRGGGPKSGGPKSAVGLPPLGKRKKSVNYAEAVQDGSGSGEVGSSFGSYGSLVGRVMGVVEVGVQSQCWIMAV